jgi:hypothetical protein
MKPRRNIPSACSACGAPMGWVFSVRNPGPKPNVPVDWDTLHAVEQNALREGQHVDFRAGHVSHFRTCTQPNRFSKARKPEGPKQRTFEEEICKSQST